MFCRLMALRNSDSSSLLVYLSDSEVITICHFAHLLIGCLLILFFFLSLLAEDSPSPPHHVRGCREGADRPRPKVKNLIDLIFIFHC